MNPNSSTPPVPPLMPSNDTSPGFGGLMFRLLRQPAALMSDSKGGEPAMGLFLFTVISALAYGVVVGSFSSGSMIWKVPLKLLWGLVASAAICTPSLYVFSVLAGATIQARQLLRLVGGLLAVSTLLLLSMAPVAWVFSESSSSVGFVGFLHWSFWLLSILFGLRLLRTCSRALGATHVIPFMAWSVIFLLVVFQMATALRPWLGKPSGNAPHEKLFFLNHWSKVIDAPANLAPPETGTGDRAQESRSTGERFPR